MPKKILTLFQVVVINEIIELLALKAGDTNDQKALLNEIKTLG